MSLGCPISGRELRESSPRGRILHFPVELIVASPFGLAVVKQQFLVGVLLMIGVVGLFCLVAQWQRKFDPLNASRPTSTALSTISVGRDGNQDRYLLQPTAS